MSRKRSATRVRLKPADSFDLIRILARSQHDPRKAIGELVQNSLDAGASNVDITWFNRRGARALRIWDDGGGVFPELARPDALRRIAHTIGHSHKRSLTPEQRRELMLIGKYGIGLLGFWSVAGTMEICSRVDGGETWCLRLEEDRPNAEVLLVPARRVDEAPTFTHISLHPIHEGAQRQIRPGRLQPYLASELRGQLLQRGVTVTIHDRVARGRARKHFKVEPERFRGQRQDDLRQLDVPGYEPAVLELYLLPEEGSPAGRVALACGGTTVIDNVAYVEGVDSPRPPWDSGRFEGVIDFPELNVAPGNRRGFQLDAAALAFISALWKLEPELEARIAEADQRRDEERQHDLSRQIRRAFVAVVAALPQYDLFDVRGRHGSIESSDPGRGAVVDEPAGDDGAPGAEPPPSVDEVGSSGELFPPGPLARLKLTPTRAKVACGASKGLFARAVDAQGRRPEGELDWSWQLRGAGQLDPDDQRATFTAPGFSTDVEIVVTARQGSQEASASCRVSVLEELLAREKAAGIPQPQAVHAPLEPWRSRIRDQRWEFNSGHRDYLTASQSRPRRLRYLIHLFAKELVLRNFGTVADNEILERMVEVLTHLGDAKLGGRRPTAPSGDSRG